MTLSPTHAALAVLAVSLATLAGAWGFQLIGGYVPCPLCLQQRWPWYAAVALGVAVAVLARGNEERTSLARVGLMLIALIMIVGAGLGAYHAGVEWKWWEGPTTCGVGAGLSGGLPDLDNARVIACDEAQWRFLGLSFAGWNVVISLAGAAIAIAGAARTAHGSSSVSQYR